MTDATEETPWGHDQALQDMQKVKFKRLPGSCDECRRKKIACDSAKLPGKVCTNCKRFESECTHHFYSRPKKSQIQKTEYILKLERRIVVLENFIRRMHPDEDLELLVSVSSVQDCSGASSYISNRKQTQSIISSDAVSPTVPSGDAKSDLSEGEDLAHVALSEHLSHLSLHSVENRYFGPAGPFMLASQVASLRREVTGVTKPFEDDTPYRRFLYWDLKPWELAYSLTIETCYEFPEIDLLANLVSLFFEKTDCLMPILHRPTFMAALSVGQHHWDSAFGTTVLMVCAIGSRYSDDPRVFLSDDVAQLSAGWKYYSQIPLHRKGMLCHSNIYDLQYYVLACLFLVGTSMSHAAFNMLSIGLRYACEMGIHRRQGPHQKPTVESEMQKRAFWAMFCLDRIGYATTGRPCSFSEEYSDIEYPIECDDEYWEPDDPQKAFQQPPGKPCTITAYIHFIKLCEILGIALRTLYVNKKSRLLAGFIGNEWERTMVAELDSSMNKWKDSLPEHLYWDPNQSDSIFFNQAANLQTMFSYVQIQIHRPFLVKKSSLSFASLAMCTNAARSCTHVFETAMSRGGLPALPNTLLAAFAAGSVIALGIWGKYKCGLKADSSSELEMFQRCINVLSAWEKRWTSAGRICDILHEAISIPQYRAMVSKGTPDKVSPQASTRKMPSTSEHGFPQMDYPSAFSFNEHETPAHSDPSNQALDRLLLTEMGYFQRSDSRDFFGTSSTGSGVHPTQADASLNDIFPPGPSLFGVETQTYTLWSDFSTAFNSSDDWEAYLNTMKQSHSF